MMEPMRMDDAPIYEEKISSQTIQQRPLPPHFTDAETLTWSSYLVQSLGSWFTVCLGYRRKSDYNEESSLMANAAPTTPGLAPEAVFQPTPIQMPRMPQHAASSFLKTGTSRGMREANDVL